MSQSQVVVSDPHALIGKPAVAVAEIGSEQALPVGPEADASHLARIREAAYRLYEARGRVAGRDVEDWLAAEAALAVKPVASAPRVRSPAATA